MITIIGIGTAADELTERAKKAIAGADRVAVRTAQSAAGKALVRALEKAGKPFETFDDAYLSSESFDELNQAVAKRLEQLAAESGSTVYCVDGDGYADATVAYYESLHEIRVLAGVADNGARKPGGACLSISAYEFVQLRPYLDTAVPLLITAIDNRILAGEVKLLLMNYYDDECAVRLTTRGKAEDVPLCVLDRVAKYDYGTSVYLAAQSGFEKQRYTVGDLQRVLARLTASDGCPWDKVQTHESIRINLIEEAYEAVDAIDDGNLDDMIEEIGDVLLQAVFHCDIAERCGEFTLGDTVTALCRKLVGRHTHIFGADRATDAGEALGFWENAKAQEKQYVSVADQLSRLPENFPATLRAQKTVKKLAKAGVAFSEEQLRDALSRRVRQTALSAKTAGEMLLLTVALLTQMGIDAETELNAASRRLRDAFGRGERDGQLDGFAGSMLKEWTE